MSDENSVSLSAWQIVGMVFAVVAALWYVSQDLRSTLKDYLTIREHQEYAVNARSDLNRIEAENKNQVSRETFKTWQQQRVHLTDDIQSRLAERVSRGELMAHVEKDKDLIASLQRQIDQLRAELHIGQKP